MTLNNRFVRSATWDGMATDKGETTPKMVALVSKLAAGEVGLILTGHAFVHEKGRHQPWQLGIHSDEMLPGLSRLADAVHHQGGKIAVQLGFGGSYLSKERVGRMTLQNLFEVVKAFGEASRRAKTAGFDGVQILAAHGFLISQFLCPRYNARTDRYGGDIGNRARILMEVVESVRTATGSAFPVLAKLNCRDFVEGGLSLEDSIRVGQMLQAAGIDAIELSGGLLNNPNLLAENIRTEAQEAYFRQEASAFKEKVRVPLILVGGIRSYSVSQRLVEAGIADYVALCRPFIREPGLIRRWKAWDLRKAECISCNNCIEQAKKGDGISCVPLDAADAEPFYVQSTREIPADSCHPPGTSYVVSFGLRQRESGFFPEIRVQMAHRGKPSSGGIFFPAGTQDPLKVHRAVEALLQEQAKQRGGG